MPERRSYFSTRIVLFVPLHGGLRNFRCESGSRERRAWLLSSDRYCDDEDGGEDFRTSEHSGVHVFDFVKHNSGTQQWKHFGATVFEPATSCSQTSRSNKLSYAPVN